jgi:hypothetical protein
VNRLVIALAIFATAPACKRSSSTVEGMRSAQRSSQASTSDEEGPRPLLRCFHDDASGSPARPLDALLDRAHELADTDDHAGALACAEEAARVEPRSIDAHRERSNALA